MGIVLVLQCSQPAAFAQWDRQAGLHRTVDEAGQQVAIVDQAVLRAEGCCAVLLPRGEQ